MLDLNRRDPGCPKFVATLERWIIDTLASFQHSGENPGRPCGRMGLKAGKAKLPDGSTRKTRLRQ